MIPLGPFCAESVMNAIPSFPRRRSKRTSLRYEVGRATSCGKRIVLITLSVVRSTQTILGPPYLIGLNIGLPLSKIHRRFAGSTTTDCTDTSVDARLFESVLFIDSVG